MDTDCLWCCKPHCPNLCPNCGLVAYCCAEHLANHYDQDKTCLPFRIRYSSSKGRYAEAIRDIEVTSLILKDVPLVIGPSRQQQMVCLECLKPEPGEACKACGLPLCSNCFNSEKLKWHGKLECPFFQERRSRDDITTTLPLLLVEMASITPLRLILQGLAGQTSYQNSKGPLYDFYCAQNYLEKTDKLRPLEIDMINVMWNRFGLKHLLDSEDIVRTAIGQVFNNAKSLERPGHNGSGLYGRYCMLNHCCVSNTKCIIHEDGGNFPLEVRAQTRILKGEEITTRYVGINVGSPSRSLMLQDHWSFTCTCKRCTDPTEMGTFASAIRCSHCPDKNGLLLPTGRIQAESYKWCCNKCDAVLDAPQVEAVIEVGLRIIKNNTSDPPEVKLLEHVIKELSNIFHSNHYLVMQVKFVLLKLLVSQDSQYSTTYEWARLTVVALSLLHALDRLDPGASRNRGNVLKDLIKPFMKLAQCELASGQIDEKIYEARKTQAQQFAKDLITCYKYENVHQN